MPHIGMRAAAAVFRAGGERQLERARGGDRVLVEHLVEIAHPEEQDGVAILALRVEILAHRRRGEASVSEADDANRGRGRRVADGVEGGGGDDVAEDMTALGREPSR